MEFLQEHSIYVVLVIVLMIWAGIAIYLARLDSKVNKLEKNFRDAAQSHKE